MNLRGLALALLGVVVAHAALAQSYPTRPVRIVVPFAAGGAVDVTGRLFAQSMQDTMKVPVIIDNRPGAGGNVGTDSVAKAAPDGYTILLTTNGHSISPSIFKKLSWAPEDFAPVSLLFSTSIVVVANATSPIRSLRDLIAAAKARPGRLNYGGSGVGNAFHLTMELLKLRAGFDMQMVTYKSDGEIINALMGNEIEIALLPVASARPFLDFGALRGLAITTPKRAAGLPDIPTVAEEAVPGFAAEGYSAFFVPAKTPREVIDRIWRAGRSALETPAVRQRLDAYAVEPVGSAPDDFAAFYRADVEKFRDIIRDARIPLQE